MGEFSSPWRRPAIVVICAVLAAGGFAAWEWSARRAARDTRRALAAGRFDDAWSAVQRWLRLRPRSPEAHYQRAKVALALGRRRDVFDGLKQAQALGCPEDRLALLRALLDAQAGRLDRARPVLARAFAAGGAPDPMLDEALARVYLETYDFGHAGAVLDRWARDAPHDPRPPLWRAAAHRRRDAEPEIILADYREALRRDPNQAEARLGLAEVLAQEHRDREAADAFDAYLALRPDDPAGHLGAGRTARERGDEVAAARALDRAVVLDPDSAPARVERARLVLQRHDPRAALADLDRAVGLAPFDPTARYHRALALKQLGRDGEAAREQSAFTRLQNERRQLDDLQERLAEKPGDPRLQGEIARWMFDHGHEAEALQWSRKVLIDTPGHPEVCRLLADYHDRRGDAEQAESFRRQARPWARR